MALSYVTALRNNQLNEITASVDAGVGTNGQLRIYDNTAARPASANDPVPGTSVLLATLTFSNPSFPAAASGSVSANAIADETNAAAGTALWFRVVDTDGNAVMDGDVGTTGSDLNLNTTSIAAGSTVSVTEFTVTAGNA